MRKSSTGPFAFLLVLLLAASGLAQQPPGGAAVGTPKRFDKLTAESFEEALRAANIPHERQGPQFFLGLVGGEKTKFEVYEPLQAVVAFHRFPGVGINQVNDWNVKAVFSRAVLVAAEKPPTARLELDFDASNGFDSKSVARFVDRTRQAVTDFRAMAGPARVDIQQPLLKTPSNFVTDVQTTSVLFPLGADEKDAQTGWKVQYGIDRRHSLRIIGAWFYRRGENPEWVKVVGDVHVNNIYVPYMVGNPRYFDMDIESHPKHGPWRLNQSGNQLALFGPSGKLLPDQYTVREDRDAGLLWLRSKGGFLMDKQTEKERSGETIAARRQEMLLWGVFQASNYFYVIQYAFQNDGVIVCRMGSTGANLSGHIGPGHMHNALWRLQLALADGTAPDAGAAPLSLSLMRHQEQSADRGTAKTLEIPITSESKYEWKPEEFSFLRLSSPAVKNRMGSQLTYDIMPLRYGSARHFLPAQGNRPSDDFMHADFWVTNNDAVRNDFRQAPAYVKDGAPLGGSPVIWLNSANLHLPRDEDMVGPPGGRTPHSATVMFSGFEIRPRSLMSNTPFVEGPRK